MIPLKICVEHLFPFDMEIYQLGFFDYTGNLIVTWKFGFVYHIVQWQTPMRENELKQFSKSLNTGTIQHLLHKPL